MDRPLALSAAAALTLVPLRVFGADGQILIAAEDTQLTADGLSSTDLTLWATSDDGSPVPDGTILPLTASLGQVVSVNPSVAGLATARFLTGTWAGTADLQATGYTVSGDTALTCGSGDPYSTTMHLHASLSEGTATMLGHTIEADQQAIDTLWWTDHDYLYYPTPGPFMEVAGYDFESGSLTDTVDIWPAPATQAIAWNLVSNSFAVSTSAIIPAAAHSGAFGWRLKGNGNGAATWRTRIYSLYARPLTLNIKSLLGDVELGMWIKPGTASSKDAELWIDLPLSDGLDGVTNVLHLYWSKTSYQAAESAHDKYVRMSLTPNTWNHYVLNLSDTVLSKFPDVGQDMNVTLATVRIRARNTAVASFDLDDFTWTQAVRGEELRDTQRAYLDSLPYGPQQLVGAETGFSLGDHLNYYGSSVPFIPYDGDEEWTTTAKAEYAQSYGGLVSYNHMFGVVLTILDEAERAAEVADATDTLVASAAYGCDLLEVGYRYREGLLQDFLYVWDALSQAGIYITGIGVNDLHDQDDWDTWANNFVTWVGSASPSEADLLWNLKRGMVTFGDPTLFPGGHVAVLFRDDSAQAVQGQVVVGATGGQDLHFEASDLQEGWQVRLVENGTSTTSWTVATTGNFALDSTIDPVGGNVVRVEVWTADGSPALFTNPIYYVDAADPGEVPGERLPAP